MNSFRLPNHDPALGQKFVVGLIAPDVLELAVGHLEHGAAGEGS